MAIIKAAWIEIARSEPEGLSFPYTLRGVSVRFRSVRRTNSIRCQGANAFLTLHYISLISLGSSVLTPQSYESENLYQNYVFGINSNRTEVVVILAHHVPREAVSSRHPLELVERLPGHAPAVSVPRHDQAAGVIKDRQFPAPKR